MLVVANRRISACSCFLLACRVSSLSHPPALALGPVFKGLPPERDECVSAATPRHLHELSSFAQVQT